MNQALSPIYTTETEHLGDWEHWMARSRMLLANDKELLERIRLLMREAGVNSIRMNQPIRMEKEQGYLMEKARPHITGKVQEERLSRSIQAAEELAECADELAAKYGVISIRKTDIAIEYHFTHVPGFSCGIGDMLVHMEKGRPGVTDYDFAAEIGEGWYYVYSIT